MLINKMGFNHVESGMNCQDYGAEVDNLKIVVDGCSSGKNSEVGAKLFCHLFSKSKDLNQTFQTLTSIFSTTKEIESHLMFTILLLEEDNDYFYVDACGDGLIIKEKHDGTFEYDDLDHNYNDFPPYYAYNFVDQDRLVKYKEGVNFKDFKFSKSDYKSIGIASDGLKFILKSIFKDEFEKLLRDRKEFGIKRLINREHNVFKDDITIAI